MLGAHEVSAKLLDEGFESGRIQKVLHGCLAGFELLVGDCEHGSVSCGSMFGVMGSKDERIAEEVFRRVYPVFKGRLNTDVDSMWLM